jgi:predicted amidophosphoribosyltransferase
MKRPALAVRRVRDWLESVERTWLGWTFPPPRVVLAEAGWAPDDDRRYCPRCGASAGPGEVTATGCATCRGVPVPTDDLVRLGAYAGPLREWVRAIKYRGWAEMADALGRRLGAAVARRLDRHGGRDGGLAVVVPMPMPWQRRLYRGIDHSRLIAAGVATELGVPLFDALAKRNGPPQVSLPAGNRARGGGGIRLRRWARRTRLDDVRVVLVDDVRTSGASLRAAARHLRPLGPRRLLAAVVAVTDERARGPGKGPDGRESPDSHSGIDTPLGGGRISVADHSGRAHG